MPSFDKYSNAKGNEGVTSVVFGKESSVLEVEMNELQEIQKATLRKAIKNILGDGITDLSKITYSGGAVNIASGCAIAVNGYMIECNGLSLAMTNGTAYVQMWEDTVSGDADLKEGGNQQKGNVPNYIKDTRVGIETSRRKVLKFTLASDNDPNKQCLAVASVKNSVMTRLCKEINLSSLADKVIDLQVQTGSYGEGVIGVECDLDNNTFRRVGDNELWSPGADYTRGSTIYGGRKRCNITDSGVVVANYGDHAYTETGALTEAVGGETYPIGTKVQAVVRQPQFWYKRIPLRVTKQVDNKYNVEGFHMTKWVDLISPVPRDGFKLHPAFKKGTTTIPYYFIGENDGCIEYTDGGYDKEDVKSLSSSPYEGEKFSSIADAKPASGASAAYPEKECGNKNLTRDAVRKLCANRGTGFQQEDVTVASAEQMLFAIEYASLNAQAISLFGVGVTNMAYTTNVNDAVPSPANTTLGNESGTIEVRYHHSNGQDYTVRVPVFRGVKNFFGNIWIFIDGFLRHHKADTDCNEAFWQDGSKEYSDNIADYIATGFSCATAGGYVKAFGYSEDCDWMYMTSLVGGDSSKPVGDNYWVNMDSKNDYIALLGANWSNGANSGPFCWSRRCEK